MQCTLSLDKIRNRVEICASGQWSMADADDFHHQMSGVRAWADRHGPVSLSILSDLNGLILHTAEIADRVAVTVDEIRFLRRDKYALVVPSYLMRMQCRRLLRGIEHRIFATRDDALSWLGWRAFAPAGAL
jgi:hypothetical protein